LSNPLLELGDALVLLGGSRRGLLALQAALNPISDLSTGAAVLLNCNPRHLLVDLNRHTRMFTVTRSAFSPFSLIVSLRIRIHCLPKCGR